MPPHLFLAALLLLAGVGIALGEPSRVPAEAPPDPPAAAPAPRTESVEDTLCRLIERSARANGLPVEFFTRLIWRESSFRSDAVSPKGAQGIAQFMPGTAADRGLADPFDPETALPASAALLADLQGAIRQPRPRCGGVQCRPCPRREMARRPRRAAAGDAGVPPLHHRARSRGLGGGAPAAGQGRAGRTAGSGAPDPPSAAALDCHATTVAIRKRGGPVAQEIATITAPWGVQLSGNFSKARALASYQRAQKQYAKLLEGTQPMIIGSRLRFRGSRAFYRVRVAQQTRKAADALCNRLRAVGGACVVFPELSAA